MVVSDYLAQEGSSLENEVSNYLEEHSDELQNGIAEIENLEADIGKPETANIELSAEIDSLRKNSQPTVDNQNTHKMCHLFVSLPLIHISFQYYR